jgi:predicted hotdog family 3-hydroxylacyl-ACP dehydratase
MTEYETPEAYLPHRAPMLLIDRVVDISEEDVVCTTHTGANGPLASVLRPDGTLSANFLIEILAQCVGVWAGYYRKERAAEIPESERDADIGLLLSVRGASLRTKFVAGDTTLLVKMHKLIQDGNLATFEGCVILNDSRLAEGKVTVYQPKEKELKTLFNKVS